METAQQASPNSSGRLISSVLDAELPLWVRLVQECREKLKSECIDRTDEPNQYKEKNKPKCADIADKPVDPFAKYLY